MHSEEPVSFTTLLEAAAKAAGPSDFSDIPGTSSRDQQPGKAQSQQYANHDAAGAAVDASNAGINSPEPFIAHPTAEAAPDGCVFESPVRPGGSHSESGEQRAAAAPTPDRTAAAGKASSTSRAESERELEDSAQSARVGVEDEVAVDRPLSSNSRTSSSKQQQQEETSSIGEQQPTETETQQEPQQEEPQNVDQHQQQEHVDEAEEQQQQKQGEAQEEGGNASSTRSASSSSSPSQLPHLKRPIAAASAARRRLLETTAHTPKGVVAARWRSGEAVQFSRTPLPGAAGGGATSGVDATASKTLAAAEPSSSAATAATVVTAAAAPQPECKLQTLWSFKLDDDFAFEEEHSD